MRFIAEQTDPEKHCQILIGSDLDGLAVHQDLARRIVAAAGQFVDVLAVIGPFHRHFVFGEGTGFVRADHRGAAQRLDRRQFADDGVALSHARYPDGQGDGHHDRQSLRDGRHGGRHGGHEHVFGALAHQNPDHEKQRRRNQNNAPDAMGKAVDFILQRRPGDAYFLNISGNMTEHSAAASSHHHAHAPTVDHYRAHEGHIALVSGSEVVLGDSCAVFLSRNGLAGQHGFIGLKFNGLDEAHIGRHPAARGQQDNVPGHHLLAVDFHFLAFAKDSSFGHHHLFQCLDLFFRFEFLNEADQSIEQQYCANHTGVLVFPQKESHHRSDHQNIDQRALELMR